VGALRESKTPLSVMNAFAWNVVMSKLIGRALPFLGIFNVRSVTRRAISRQVDECKLL
jgi:hypothetical protein